MKKTILLLFVAVGLVAAAQQPKVFRTDFKPQTMITNVVVKDGAKVTVLPDTEVYLLLKSDNMVEIPQEVVTVLRNTIVFDNEIEPYGVELHVNTPKLTITIEDNATLVLDMSSDTAKAGLQVLTISAEDHSQTTVKASTDTLQLVSLDLEAEDGATIVVEPFVSTLKSRMSLDDDARISYNGIVYRPTTSVTDMMDRRADTDDLAGSKRTKKSDESFPMVGSHAQFLWGWNNWGERPMAGLFSVDGDDEVVTTFQSFQLGYVVEFALSRFLSLEAGLEYESDIYRFAAQLVDFHPTGNAGEAAFVDVTPALTDYKARSRFVTRYITLPVAVAMAIPVGKGKKDRLCLALAAVPGLGFSSGSTGLKTRETTVGHTTRSTSPVANHYMNPYKFDVRLSAGFDHFYFFVQPSLLPVFKTDGDKHLNHELYPIKFGFQLGL
ncbi:MAG: hypothetical protein IJ789_03655 [Bacteroidales bacterium]|nr:hypothetical protein [Bacteroidales bacterium]